MNRHFDNKITNIKKREQDRRVELAMLDLLIDKYPEVVEKKIKKRKPILKAEKELKDD